MQKLSVECLLVAVTYCDGRLHTSMLGNNSVSPLSTRNTQMHKSKSAASRRGRASAEEEARTNRKLTQVCTAEPPQKKKRSLKESCCKSAWQSLRWGRKSCRSRRGRAFAEEEALTKEDVQVSEAALSLVQLLSFVMAEACA